MKGDLQGEAASPPAVPLRGGCDLPGADEVLDQLPDAVLVVDLAAVVRRANAAAGVLLDAGPGPLVGLPATDLLRPLLLDATPFLEALRDPVRDATVDLPFLDDRVVQAHAAPLTDRAGTVVGQVWTLHDDTDRRTADAQRTALLARLAQAERVQRFLLEASDVLGEATGYTETLQALAGVAVPTLGDLCLIDVLDDDGRTRRVAAVHADPSKQALVEELRLRYAPDPQGLHPSLDAMRSRTSRWAAEMPDEFLRATTRDEEHFRVVKALEFTSYMTVPLVGSNVVLGAVTLVSSGSGRRFGPQDVRLAEQLADRVAVAVAKERRYDVERRISHTLQTGLLPVDLPSVPGVELAVRYLPGTADAEVGGDFWDVAVMPDGEVAVALGDVAGHDIQAAATMAQLRSACRALRAQTHGPDELVNIVHESWDQLGLDRIATAVFARLVPETGRLRIASAGHLPPLVVEPDRAWFPAVDPAPPLGAPSPALATAWVGELPRGATVLFYTDGLVEDRHRDLDEGTDRLVRAARTAPSLDAEPLLDHVLATVPGDDRADDVAVLAVRLLP